MHAHPPPQPLALHVPTKAARQEREDGTDRTLRPQLPIWIPALDILAGAKKKKKNKARIIVQSPPQTQCIHFYHSYHELVLTSTNHH